MKARTGHSWRLIWSREDQAGIIDRSKTEAAGRGGPGGLLCQIHLFKAEASPAMVRVRDYLPI